MQLVAIRATVRPNQVFLVFDTGLKLPFFVDDILVLHLHKNQDIGPEEEKKIICFSLTFLLKNYLLHLLAISPKTEKTLILRSKIFLKRAQKKFNLSTDVDSLLIINDVITFLKSKNLLSEEDFIDSFIRKNKNKSLRHLRFLLENQGISYDLINSKLSGHTDTENLKKLIEKHKHKDRNKIVASLYRKGFSLEDINGLIDAGGDSK